MLGQLRRDATPATFEQAKAARDTVVAVSLHCAAREGCLARSLATVPLPPERPVGDLVRRRPADAAVRRPRLGRGRGVGEDYPPDYFRTFFTVPGRP